MELSGPALVHAPEPADKVRASETAAARQLRSSRSNSPRQACGGAAHAAPQADSVPVDPPGHPAGDDQLAVTRVRSEGAATPDLAFLRSPSWLAPATGPGAGLRLPLGFGRTSDPGTPLPLARKAAGVGTPEDPWEREADAAAERAMAPAPANLASPAAQAAAHAPAPPVQRMCAACTRAAALGQSQPCPECGDGPLQLKAVAERPASELDAADIAAIVRSLHGRGEPLDPGLRADFESRLGADFSAVRIHTGNYAAAAARALGAHAFTHRQHVVFGEGEYDPRSPPGRRLLIHELTHTVQQGASPPASPSSPTDTPGAPDPRLALTPGARAPPIQRQEEADGAGASPGMLLAAVSPGLAEIVSSGPVGWIGKKLKAGVKEAVGGLVSGLGLSEPFETLQSKLDNATSLLSRAAKGGADGCQAFKQILEAIHDVGSAIANSEVVQQISSAINAVTDVVGKIVKFVVGGTFEMLKEVLPKVWDAVSSAASTVWGWIQRAKNALGSAWDWVAGKLGIGGDSESGVWAWIKRQAAAAWDSIAKALAPIIGPLTTVAKVLVAISPLGPVFILTRYGPEIVEVVAFMWSHRDDPDIARHAHEKMAHTFLPGLIDGVGNLRERLGSAADWLIEQLGALSTAALELAGGVTGLPLLAEAKSFVQGVADTARQAFSWAQLKLTEGVQWLTDAAKRAWQVVSPYKEVLGSLALAIANPPMIPVILAGWAWRAIPYCYKAPIIDFILDIAIGALSSISGVITFGPLWALLKPGVIAFLKRLKQAQDWVKEKVSNRIARIISGASPEFLLGFVKGFFTGVWEGVVDTFKAIATVVDGLNWVQDMLAGVIARALGLKPPAPTPKLSAIFGDDEEKLVAEKAPGSGRQPEPAGAAGGPGPEPRPLFKEDPAKPAPAVGADHAPPGATAAATEPAAPAAPEPATPVGAEPATLAGTGPATPAAPEPAAAAPPVSAAEPDGAGAPAAAAPAATPLASASGGTSTLARASHAPATADAGGSASDPGTVPESPAPAAVAGPEKVAPLAASATPAGPAAAEQERADHDPDTAEVVSRGMHQLEPHVSIAVHGFWPAIKEYFSSSPSVSFDTMVGKLSDAWESVKSKIAGAATDMATQITAFFVGDQAEETIGTTTGSLVGQFAFQALLDALTAGIWTELEGVLQGIAGWAKGLIQDAFKLLSKLGRSLLDGLKSLGNVIKEAGGGAIRKVMEALGAAGHKLIELGEELFGRVAGALRRRAGALEHGAGSALEREGGHLARGEAERLEQRKLAQGLKHEPKPGAAEPRPAPHEPAAPAGREPETHEREPKLGEHEGKPGEHERKPEEHERKPGEDEERKPGEEEDPAAQQKRKQAELPEAIAIAREFDAAMQAQRMPVPLVRAALIRLLRRFRWLKDVRTEPPVGRSVEVYLIGCKHDVGKYTVAPPTPEPQGAPQNAEAPHPPSGAEAPLAASPGPGEPAHITHQRDVVHRRETAAANIKSEHEAATKRLTAAEKDHAAAVANRDTAREAAKRAADEAEAATKAAEQALPGSPRAAEKQATAARRKAEEADRALQAADRAAGKARTEFDKATMAVNEAKDAIAGAGKDLERSEVYLKRFERAATRDHAEVPRLGRDEPFDPKRRRPLPRDRPEVKPHDVDHHIGGRTNPNARVSVFHEEPPTRLRAQHEELMKVLNNPNATQAEKAAAGHAYEKLMVSDLTPGQEKGFRLLSEAGDKPRKSDHGVHEFTVEGELSGGKLDQLWRDLLTPETGASAPRDYAILSVPKLSPTSERDVAKLAADYEHLTGRRPSIMVRVTTKR